jgi:hypothetical protein
MEDMTSYNLETAIESPMRPCTAVKVYICHMNKKHSKFYLNKQVLPDYTLFAAKSSATAMHSLHFVNNARF